MTEQEWLACRKPAEMLAFLAGRVSDPKYRFFVAACCRRIWHLLPEAGRRAVEVGERYADGLATGQDLREAAQAVFERDGLPANEAAFHAVATTGAYHLAATVAAAHAAQAVARAADPEDEDTLDPAEQAEQCRLLREIFGNPFWPVSPEATWLTWNDGTVARVAQGIHESRSFEDLPVLADALIEAGCQEVSILAHCRQPGDHVPGCWVVDALREALPNRPRPDPEGDFRKALTDALIVSGKRTLEDLDGMLKAVEESRRKKAAAFAGRLAWGILIVVVVVWLLLLWAR
jgi:hypothetical protein